MLVKRFLSSVAARARKPAIAEDNLRRRAFIFLDSSYSFEFRGEQMPLLDKSAQFVTNRLPKVISPAAHAVIDYAMAVSFLAMGAFFWKRNKRAAVSSFICGGAEVVTALMTDYPGGVAREISFETHGAIDFGLSGMAASMP